MKPNLVAPGQMVTSAKADMDATNKYKDDFGTSMAAPHVTGLAATLMEHYPAFKYNPAMVRAHMMSTAIAPDDVPGKSNDYGLGRVSGYLAHWDHPNSDGWSTYRYWGTVSYHGYAYGDIVVPPGTKRLVVVAHVGRAAGERGRKPGRHVQRGSVAGSHGLHRPDRRVRRVLVDLHRRQRRVRRRRQPARRHVPDEGRADRCHRASCSIGA